MKLTASLTALVLIISVPAIAATNFSTLEERMTGREFRESGLHKLTDEELAFLNRWIQMRSLAEGEVPDWARDAGPARPAAAAPGAPAAATDQRGFLIEDRREINSRLVGSFSGWRGDAVFVLENGMVWQQAESDVFVIPTVENPEVRIRPGMFGSWTLQIVGYNSRVRVRRVE